MFRKAAEHPERRGEKFLRREPYFAVLTSPKYLRANLTPANEREFFDSGEAFVDWALATIDERLVPEFAPVSVLEYGCGAGRLAIPLARRPGAVTAVDQSPAMLDAARDAAQRHAVTHIRFETPAELFGRRRRFDLVTCYHVFQRMPQDEGLSLLRELVGCISSEGVGVFQFPYQTKGPRGVDAIRWMRTRIRAFNGVVNLARNKPFDQPFIPTHAYNLDPILRLF